MQVSGSHIQRDSSHTQNSKHPLNVFLGEAEALIFGPSYSTFTNSSHPLARLSRLLHLRQARDYFFPQPLSSPSPGSGGVGEIRNGSGGKPETPEGRVEKCQLLVQS